MSGNTELKNSLKAYAQELGFTDCRISPPVLPPEYVELHQAWLRCEFHGGMRYLERRPNQRYDARMLLTGCRSVIVCALPYSREPITTKPENRGTPVKIAGYAAGADYHVVVHKKLNAICDWLTVRIPNIRLRVTVDTSPLAEKAFAVAAGIGWQGRHSLVLNRSIGSRFLLGTVLVNASFEPDAPLKDNCGDCNRCVDACPVDALPQPSVLDARRCLSFITTARKTPVGPNDELHGWFFGCDACQQACPHNHNAYNDHDAALNKLKQLQSLSAEAVVTADNATLSCLLKGTVLAERQDNLLKSAALRLIED